MPGICPDKRCENVLVRDVLATRGSHDDGRNRGVPRSKIYSVFTPGVRKRWPVNKTLLKAQRDGGAS